MDGTAIYQGVCAIFIASCFGIDLTFSQMATIVLTATLASIGTAGVDRIFDMGRTTVNITGDAACTVIVDKLEKRKPLRPPNNLETCAVSRTRKSQAWTIILA